MFDHHFLYTHTGSILIVALSHPSFLVIISFRWTDSRATKRTTDRRRFFGCNRSLACPCRDGRRSLWHHHSIGTVFVVDRYCSLSLLPSRDPFRHLTTFQTMIRSHDDDVDCRRCCENIMMPAVKDDGRCPSSDLNLKMSIESKGRRKKGRNEERNEEV